MRICVKCSAPFEGRRCMECHKRISAAYAAANKDKVKEYKAAYLLANGDRVRAAATLRRKSDPEKTRLAKARHAELHSASIVARVAAWRKKNQDAHREQNHNYRARKRGAGSLSKGLAQKLFKLQKGKCACCGKPLGTDYEMDHIMPLALGGTNTDDNIQLLTTLCNGQKHAKHPVEFMQQRGFLL